MDYSNNLVLGLPIKFKDICTIHQLNVEEIAPFESYEKYEQLLIPYRINKESLNITDDNIKNFDLLFIKLKDEEKEIDTISLFIESLKFFCKEKNVFINKDNLNLVFQDTNKTGINRDNFDEFADIILKINGIQKMTPSKPPGSKEKLNIWEKLKQGRERTAKDKVRKGLNLATIINTVKFGMETYISKEEINKMTVWELYNAYNNVMNKERFKNNFDIYLVAGNEKKELDLTHWALKTI